MDLSRWQTIESIFNDTLTLPLAERERFLTNACKGDAELRAEVDSLLREIDEPGEFLSQSTFTLGAKLLARDAGELQATTVGYYKIIRPIGRGGMGDVFLAEDQRLGRLVAIKMLPPSLTRDRDSALRFQQEARAASAISHPNIGHIYEFGQTKDRDYLVMEYVEGKTLRDLLKKGPLDLDQALDIAIQIGEALKAAHEANIIHRDIKPENVMIRRDGYVKILDFGLAKFTLTNESGRRALSSQLDTTPGLIMGTTAYMSPEQIRGQTVDARTDIWSFGVMIYEMLSGQLPFSGGTPSDIRAAVLLKEPAPLIVPHLTTEETERARHIVMKALEKVVDDRYPSLTELLDALQQLRSARNQSYRSGLRLPLWDSSTGKQSLPPTPAFQHTSPNLGLLTNVHNYWVRRTRAAKVTIIVAIMAVAMLSSWRVVSLVRNHSVQPGANVTSAMTPRAIDSLLIIPFDNETGDIRMDYLSSGLADDLIRNIGRGRAFPVISLASALRAKAEKFNYRQIRDRLGVANLLEGTVKQDRGTIVIETRLIDLATSRAIWQDKLNAPETDLLKLRNALALLLANKLQELSAGEKRLVFAEYPTSNNEAYKLYLKAKFDRRRSSVNEFRELIRTLEKAVALDDHYTLAYVALAENYNLLGTFLGQYPAYYQPKAKHTLEKALALDDSLFEAHALLGKIKMDYEHDWTGSEREFKRAIELNPNDEQAHHWYGEVYLSAMKRLDQSISELETAHRLNPLSSGILTGLSWSHLARGDYEKALAECNQALEVNAADTGIYDYRAKVFFKLGRFDEAIADAKKSFELDPTARYLATLGVFYSLSGRQSEARDVLKRLKTDKTIGEVSNYDLAIVHGALGERDEAFRLLNAETKSNSVDLLSIRIDPLLDQLRSDARFAQLEQRFHFPDEKTS